MRSVWPAAPWPPTASTEPFGSVVSPIAYRGIVIGATAVLDHVGTVGEDKEIYRGKEASKLARTVPRRWHGPKEGKEEG